MQSSHKRQPSINSQTFSIDAELPTEEQLQHTEYNSDSDSSSSLISANQTRDEHFNAADYVTTSLQNSINAIELDKAIAIESQISGTLNSKNLELIELEGRLVDRLNELKDLSKGRLERIKEIKKHLAWSDKRLVRLAKKVQDSNPIEYNQAKEKVLERIVDE